MNRQHRRPVIPFADAPRGTCRWCGETIVYAKGPKRGKVDTRRRWHPRCLETYEMTDPRGQRRRVRKRDRGVCRACGLDTNALRRRVAGRGRAGRLRALGFLPRRSLWELDHIVPLIDGGGHEFSNLQTLCVPCHRKKTTGETRQRASARSESRPEMGPASAETSEDALVAKLDRLMRRADRTNARAERLLARDETEPYGSYIKPV